MFSVTIYLKVKNIQNQKCSLEHNILKVSNYSKTCVASSISPKLFNTFLAQEVPLVWILPEKHSYLYSFCKVQFYFTQSHIYLN